MDSNKNDIKVAHGKQQNIKMALLKWLNEGKNAYEIIYELAKYLEEISAEPGYAKIVLDDIRNVYGIGLNEYSVISDELLELRGRLQKLQNALGEQSDEETQKRLKFAIEHHEKKIQELERKLAQA